MVVHQDGDPIYEIILETDFGKLGAEVEKLQKQDHRICIVADSNVAEWYLDEVTEILKTQAREVTAFVFPAGEEHKTLNVVRDLYEFLIENHFDRKDLLAALGGGVTGDLCGFVAATYLRGIDFIQIPTTLLSQVDSSIGGKTGVDFDSYKNMIGAFHMPKLVYTNLSTLKTLDETQFSSGMGEVIKHGLIKNASYYHWLLENRDSILKRDPEICRQMVLESNRIKRDVVENDPKEQGERALLNFGHTLGHAIEKLEHFSLTHGHCVGLGCIAAAKISAMRGLLSMEEVREIRATMKSFSIPTTICNLSPDEVVKTTKSDKKMDAGKVKFILLRTVGDAFVDRTVTDEEMKEAVAYLMETEE